MASSLPIPMLGLLIAISQLLCLPGFLLDTRTRGISPGRQNVIKSSLLHAAARKSLSSSDRERREEEKRRQERAGDVVIGKTSAISDASDYNFDVSSTEEQWMMQASKVEQEVFKQTERGMECLGMLQLEEAAEAFDRVFQLRPSSYLWQAGIVKYYLRDLEEAADIFARNAATYESKFGFPATEERIWRHACELKMMSSLDRRERKRVEESGGVDDILTQIEENENTAELMASEGRRVLRTARDLFSATVERDFSTLILSRAKLHSIAGAFDSQPVLDKKMWNIYAWFYLGLHYDSLGEVEESKKCMKMALRLRPSAGKSNDIIHSLPMIHMSQRQWFDEDDDFESDLFESTEEEGNAQTVRSKPTVMSVEADPVLIESMKVGIAKLRLPELQETLRLRGLPAAGSKGELRKKLFKSLLDDTGLM